MKKKVIILGAIISVLVLTGCIEAPVPPEAYDYYVSVYGDDSNNGTQEYPWKTLEKASQIESGTSILIGPGTYYERMLIENDDTAFVSDGAIIDGRDNPKLWSGTIEIGRVKNVTVDGFELVNIPYFGFYIKDGCDNIIIRNNKIINCQSSGIQVYWQDYSYSVPVTNIYINNNTIDTMCMNMDQEGISLVHVDGFEVTNNTLRNCSKEGINAKHGCSNGIIEWNTVYDCADTKSHFYIDAYGLDSYNIIVENNRAYGIGEGISLATEEGGTLNNIYVRHNYVNVTNNAFSIHRYTTPGTHYKDNIHVQYNTFIGERAVQITELPERFGVFVMDDNVLVDK